MAIVVVHRCMNPILKISDNCIIAIASKAPIQTIFLVHPSCVTLIVKHQLADLHSFG